MEKSEEGCEGRERMCKSVMWVQVSQPFFWFT
jgi:hypothetical protein